MAVTVEITRYAIKAKMFYGSDLSSLNQAQTFSDPNGNPTDPPSQSSSNFKVNGTDNTTDPKPAVDRTNSHVVGTAGTNPVPLIQGNRKTLNWHYYGQTKTNPGKEDVTNDNGN